MKKAMQLFSQLFGFEKLSKYEREHLHEANMQSSAYMGFIGVMLEIWMLIRQTITRIIPAYQEGGKLFELVFTYGQLHHVRDFPDHDVYRDVSCASEGGKKDIRTPYGNRRTGEKTQGGA